MTCKQGAKPPDSIDKESAPIQPNPLSSSDIERKQLTLNEDPTKDILLRGKGPYCLIKVRPERSL